MEGGRERDRERRREIQSEKNKERNSERERRHRETAHLFKCPYLQSSRVLVEFLSQVS